MKCGHNEIWIQANKLHLRLGSRPSNQIKSQNKHAAGGTRKLIARLWTSDQKYLSLPLRDDVAAPRIIMSLLIGLRFEVHWARLSVYVHRATGVCTHILGEIIIWLSHWGERMLRYASRAPPAAIITTVIIIPSELRSAKIKIKITQSFVYWLLLELCISCFQAERK